MKGIYYALLFVACLCLNSAQDSAAGFSQEHLDKGVTRIKRIILISILIATLPALALSQTKSQEEFGSARIEQEILRLENEWMNGVVHKDGKVLDRLMADDFRLLNERWTGDRGLTPKQPWIKNSLTSIEAKSFTFDKVQMQVRENVVVFHCLFTFEAMVNGKPWGGTARLTDTWIKEGGRWRVLARHASRALQPPPSQ